MTRGDIESARERHESAAAGAQHGEAQRLTRVYGNGAVGVDALTVERCAEVSAGDGDDVGRIKAEVGPHHRAFEHSLALIVVDEDVGDRRAARIHHAGDGHAVLLVADAAEILYDGEHAGVENGDAHACSASFLG